MPSPSGRMKLCDRQGCAEPAEYRVCLKLWAPQLLYPGSPPSNAALALFVCATHRTAVASARDIVNDEGWRQIVEGFERAGRPAPVRSTAEVYFMPIGSPDERSLSEFEEKAAAARVERSH